MRTVAVICRWTVSRTGACGPFFGDDKFFTPRDACYCGSRHKHGQLALSIQLFPLVIYFDMFAISIKGSFPTMGTLLFKQGDKVI